MIRTRLWTRLFENCKAAEKSCDADASFCVLVDDVPTLRQRAGKFEVSDDSFTPAGLPLPMRSVNAI